MFFVQLIKKLLLPCNLTWFIVNIMVGNFAVKSCCRDKNLSFFLMFACLQQKVISSISTVSLVVVRIAIAAFHTLIAYDTFSSTPAALTRAYINAAVSGKQSQFQLWLN